MNFADISKRLQDRPKERILMSGSTLRMFQSKKNVMTAVILRDMRTRFFNHGLGFLVAILWPVVHMGILLVTYNLAGRQAPFGDSLNVFFATGLVPTLAFTYISRFMSYSLVTNGPLLTFPAVTVLDILAARAFLEIIAACSTLLVFLVILWALGDDPMPYNPLQAVYAYMATVLLAVGFGTLVGVMVMFFQFVLLAYSLILILVYIGSGTMFVANSLPSSIADALAWNPVVQAVEWMRTAYFESYSDRLVNKPYLIFFGLSTLCLGLLLERVLRQRMLDG